MRRVVVGRSSDGGCRAVARGDDGSCRLLQRDRGEHCRDTGHIDGLNGPNRTETTTERAAPLDHFGGLTCGARCGPRANGRSILLLEFAPVEMVNTVGSS